MADSAASLGIAYALTVRVPQPRKSTHWVTFRGARMALSDAARLAGLRVDTVCRRLRAGWTEADALSTPVTPTAWTERELDLLRRFYRSKHSLRLKKLAKLIGRGEGNISRKARELGLTNQSRLPSFQPSLPFGIGKLSPEQQSEHLSRAHKERLKRKGHPRGALGMKHKPETLERIAASSRAKWADPNSRLNSPDNRQRLSDLMLKNVVAGKMNTAFRFSRSRAGKRDDLGGIFFRSRWEANYARYLNWRKGRGDILGWEYEAKTFVFEKISRGTRSYTPDFKVTKPDGSHEWHEVKGWMDPKSRTRLDRMARYYPEERLVVIGEDWFKSARRNGISNMLKGWE